MKTVHFEGRNYSLCGDFAELVKAETYFGERVSGVNLATAIVDVKEKDSALNAIRQILPCALHKFHPETSWDDAQKLIDRSLALDQATILQAVYKDIWPAVTEQTKAANRNLSLDLDALAEANEYFEGRSGLLLLLAEAPPRLDQVWRTFPCAVHGYRPELSLDEVRDLMTLESVPAVMGMLRELEQTATPQQWSAFAQRVLASSLEHDKADFTFRIIASQQWPGGTQ